MQLSIVTVADMRTPTSDNERTLVSRTAQCPDLDDRTINSLL